MEKKKEAVKKVIAAMTVGKDVSMLFTDVVNCIQTQNIELKKLVYLYLINYAKSQPDLAILAVNTFKGGAKGVRRTSSVCAPLARSLTGHDGPEPAHPRAGCAHDGLHGVDKIVEYLCDPLRKCLKVPGAPRALPFPAASDSPFLAGRGPHVRKTAAVWSNSFDINGELVEEQGFLDNVYDLLSDSNPMVVSNAVASLAEISETSDMAQKVFQINTSTLQKMLAALNECTEGTGAWRPRPMTTSPPRA